MFIILFAYVTARPIYDQTATKNRSNHGRSCRGLRS